MTSRPTSVRLVHPGEEAALFTFVCSSDEEWCLGPRDDTKVRRIIDRAAGGGPMPRPVFGLVPGEKEIEGAVGLFPTELWNSSELYLRVFFHYVHPNHRRTRHAVHLAEFAKWFGEESGMPVVFELLHPELTANKAQLFGRQARPAGGLYIHEVAA